MNLVIADWSALDFYRQKYPANRAPDAPQSALQAHWATRNQKGAIQSEAHCASREDDVWSLAPDWITPQLLEPEGGTLHVMVPDKSGRNRSQTAKAHVWSGELPPGSLYDFGGSTAIASPEFLFLWFASTLGFSELVCLGDELCGLYSFNPSAKRGLRQRGVPLTTKEKLQSYIANARRARGSRRASDALKHVVERSASPMETADEMLACLPCRRGGYGLPEPIMNYPIALNGHARRIAGKETCYADCCWPESMLVLEHNGGFDHTLPGAQAADRARVNALQEMGYGVIELTGDQVSGFDSFESIVLHMARILGKRVPSNARGRLPQRIQLRHDIFAWNNADGRHR